MAQPLRGRALRPPFDQALDDESRHGEEGEERGDGEGGGELVLVVEDLDVERNRRRQAPDVPRHDRDRTELPHRARVAEHDAVQQPPADLGKAPPPDRLPPVRAERARRFLFLAPLGLHQRDQLPGHERAGHEDGCQQHSGQGEDDLDVVLLQPGAEKTLQAEKKHVDQTGDNRRDGERKVDERDEHVLPRELELGDGPGRCQPEDHVQRHGDPCDQQCQTDGGPGVRLADRLDVGGSAFLEGVDEHGREGDEEEQRKERERGADEGPPDGRMLRERARRGRPSRLHAHVLRRLHCWSPLIARSRTKDAASITTAIAVAPAVSYCSSFVMISRGAISVRIGMFPEMKTTEPYSPTARAKASVDPVTSEGRTAGSRIRRKTCQRPAPRLDAASSTSRSRSSRTGWTVRTTNGRPTKVRAITTPRGVKATRTPAS